jgi:hypothetical protein
MSKSPLLVTKTGVEDINRALNDLSQKIGSDPSASIKAVSSSYSFKANDGLFDLFVTCGTNDVTINLDRSAANKGRVMRVWKADAGVGEVVVKPNGTETINGYATVRAGLQYQHCDIYQDGQTNFLIGQYTQPVASEPSLGTWHDVAAPVDAWLLNQVVAAGTWYTVTFPVGAGAGYVPVGTKKVKAYGQLFKTTAAVNSTMFYRIYGSGAGTNRCRSLLSVYTALLDDVISAGQIELPIDSQGRVEVSCDIIGPTAQISNAFGYCC